MNHTMSFTPGLTEDYTPLIREALNQPLCGGLYFAPGRYDFHAQYAAEQYLFISNNDEGLKRVVFRLTKRDGFVIEASGAQFIFHGALIPFLIEHCRDVRLDGPSLDWEIPFHGEAVVIRSSDQLVDMEIRRGFPFRVREGRLEFGPSPDTFEIGNILEFDAARNETAFRVYDNFDIGRRAHAEQIGASTVRMHAAFRHPLPQEGNVLAIMSGRRDCPAIAAQNSSGLTLCNLRIHHAGAMGFVAQRCENIRIENVQVVPPEDGTRMLSTTADATHFVHCRGTIFVENCRFENQMDDAVNVHGIYAPITRILGPAEFELRLSHYQQFGVELAASGDLLEIVDRASLETFHTSLVEDVQPLNKEYLRIRLASAPARPPCLGDSVGNLSWSANATIRNCFCRGNRARGFLLSTPGHTLVEGNTFHTPGAGILIEGDANFWFESGAVRDVVIRGNTFEDCLYGIWGRAVIQISPGIKAAGGGGSRYHRNIRIENNLFRAFDPRIVRARGVDGLTIRNNRILTSVQYPPQNTNDPVFDTEGCSHVRIEENPIDKNTHVPSHAV